MSHEPPIPEAARSPYPLQPPPIASRESADAGPDGAAERQDATGARADRTDAADQSWAGKAREVFDSASQSKMALGAAVGIGSAALVAALLFTRRGKGRRSIA